MAAILNQLRPTDYFNLVYFSDMIRVWQTEGLVLATERKKRAAEKWVRQAKAAGGRWINQPFFLLYHAGSDEPRLPGVGGNQPFFLLYHAGSDELRLPGVIIFLSKKNSSPPPSGFLIVASFTALATNINGALQRGAEMLEAHANLSRLAGSSPASFLVFLTDGDPTSGETNLALILRNTRAVNKQTFTLFSLGFGSDLDFLFLTQLSLQVGIFSPRFVFYM